MNILYLSCHSILEYDELKLFEELGATYFSLGSYLDPRAPVDNIRPPLSQVRVERWYEKAPDRNNIPQEFFDEFDVIIVMHIPEWVENNWEKMRHKRVIWRTIGQSTPKIEKKMKKFVDEGLEVVRYSPAERTIEGYAGENALIRFYKDPAEFGQYNGKNQRAITFTQNMKARGEFCNYEAFMEIANGLPVTIYGPNNEDMGPMAGGKLSYEGMRAALRDSTVYIYTGTQPACYTLSFIEAWMTGIPIVAVGPRYGNSMEIASSSAYEIPSLITDGVDGFWSDDITVLKTQIKALLAKPKLAEMIGKAGRESAIKFFGKDKIKAEWKEYLGL